MASQPDRSLLEKLGYATDEAVDTVDAPEWFLEYLRGNGVHTHAKLPTEWLHMFMTDLERTQHFIIRLKFNEIQKGIWISWPTNGSGIHTNITEQAVRDIVSRHGWAQIDTCTINDTWSAALFARPKH